MTMLIIVRNSVGKGASKQRFFSTVAANVDKFFPKAVTNAELVEKTAEILKDYGFGPSSLVATSLCCDEVNRVLEQEFAKVYGDNFSMGGLAGFPFGGVTSFGAMAHHIPDDGSCLVIFGPHVGVDSTGVVGKIDRRGRAAPGACCGAACAAAGHVDCVLKGEVELNKPTLDPLDAQQAFVNTLVMPHAERLSKADDVMVELPHAIYDSQKELMDKIVAAGCQEVAGDGKIALLGGVQINTPDPDSDYFLPLSFEVRTNKNEMIKDLMWTSPEEKSSEGGFWSFFSRS